ncbi:MAG: hypothetical protein ACMG6E_02230, partial [Candidatus Roizmanbacteria bacterium]
VSSTEFQYLAGLTSSVQTQLTNLSAVATVTTSNATTTTIATIATTTGTSYGVKATIVARRTDAGTESATYVLTYLFRNNAGTLTSVSSDLLAIADTKAWTAVMAVSGTSINMNVNGEASKTINWKVSYRYLSV